MSAIEESRPVEGMTTAKEMGQAVVNSEEEQKKRDRVIGADILSPDSKFSEYKQSQGSLYTICYTHNRRAFEVSTKGIQL